MAKRKQAIYNGRGLFDAQTQVEERKIRRQRALFIPHYETFHEDHAGGWSGLNISRESS